MPFGRHGGNPRSMRDGSALEGILIMKMFSSMNFKIAILSAMAVLLTTVVLVVTISLSQTDAERIIPRAGFQVEDSGISSREIQKNLDEYVSTLKKRVALTGTIILILTAFASFIYAGNLTKTIKQAVVLFEKISKGDMTCRFKDIADDEMGEMAKQFNYLMDNLLAVMKKVIIGNRLSIK